MLLGVAVGLRASTLPAWVWIVLALLGVGLAWSGLCGYMARWWGPTFEPGLMLAVGWLAMVVLSAITADLLPLAEGRDPSRALTEPILSSVDLFSGHPLGTDRQGLDLFAGVIYGARVSMLTGFTATVFGLVVGGLLGVLAGFYRGRVDTLLTFINDCLLAFPPLILLLALASVIEPSIKNIALVLGVLAVPTFYRLTRANTLVYAQRDFVLAARALGASGSRILLKELVPNVLMAAMSYAFIVFAVLVVAEASLSFLGLGIQRPEPTWGNLIAAGQQDFNKYPHLVFVPGIVLFFTVLALNRVGDWTRRRWDPRARKI